ncbi:MAG: von Willebrand factor type [Crocinitomicaceae bacterium]|jgi:Ca-activated chloride channel family protein|nr:von Willebrand factor type [Crocinitomicaceae bacterium]
MSNRKYIYNTRLILGGIFLWELLFWALFWMVLWMMDAFSNSAAGQLAFKDEEKLDYLWVLIPVIGAFLWFVTWKNKRLQQLGNERILSLIVQPIDSSRVFLRFFLFRNAVVFLIIAMAQPVFGNKKVSGTLETMELVLALDVSTSMNTRDIDPETSRLEVVKRAMNQLVNTLHGEKIGIAIFAGGSYLQLPLTADYEAAKMYIHEIETDMVSNQGTNVAAALDISAKMFSKDKTSKAILVVTDGENHEGGLDEPLAVLKENNITLAVLGIGTTKGGLIPNNPDRPELGNKTDASGRTIVSKMNPAFIHDLARQAGGFSVISESPYPNLEGILDNIKQLKRTKVEGIELDIKENWYQVPLLLGMICLLLFVLPIRLYRVKK